MIYKGSIVKGSGGGSGTVDQTYDPTSTNAQSGTAVAEAVATVTVSYDNSTINENASNQLQAIGVVDKNISHDSGSLHYMPLWEGTQQEYDTGAQTTFYDWTYNVFGFDTVQISSPGGYPGLYVGGCYGNSKYFVLDGVNRTVAYSSDTETWNTFPANTLPDIMPSSVAYGAGKFVATGSEGSAYSADDGEHWTEISNLKGNRIKYGEVNNASAFFILYENKLLTSSDGINWSDVEGFNYNTLFPGDYAVDICLGMGTIWILTETSKIAYSSDLTNWAVETIENDSYSWSRIACSDSNVCAIREDGRTALRALGQWSITNTETISDGMFATLVWNSNSYIAISTDGIIRQSNTTGNSWSVIGNIPAAEWYNGFYGNGKIVVGGEEEIAYGGNITQNIYTITNEPNAGDSTYSEPNGNSKNGHNKEVLEYDSEEDTIQLVDETVFNRNQAGDTLGPISVGEAHPEYLCFIDGNVVKRGDAEVANKTIVDQAYDSSSTNAQSGVAVAQALATIDLTAYQTTANLTTSLSSASTDTQYPSAKCVYDIVGDIETLLSQV